MKRSVCFLIFFICASFANSVFGGEDVKGASVTSAAFLHFERFGFGFANHAADVSCPVELYHDGIGIVLDPDFCSANRRGKPLREISAYGSFNVVGEFPSPQASILAECKGRPVLRRYRLDHRPSAACRVEDKDQTIRFLIRTFRNSDAPDRSQWIEITLQLQTTRDHWSEDLRVFKTYLAAFKLDPDDRVVKGIGR